MFTVKLFMQKITAACGEKCRETAGNMACIKNGPMRYIRIIFCFSDHPVTVSSDNKEAFLYAANKEPFVWDCVFEIGLDENYFSISFDAEKFSKKKFIPEIEKVLLKQDALSGRQRQDNDT